MPRTLTLTETNWFTNDAPDDPKSEMRLWVGHDEKGARVLCWVPEWVSPEAWEDGIKQFEDYANTQAKRLMLPRRRRVIRANKVKGAN